jgi:hypothetical protein
MTRESRFRANVRKCFLAESKFEYLGYTISRNGIQPQPKKVEVILGLKEPQNKRTCGAVAVICLHP